MNFYTVFSANGVVIQPSYNRAKACQKYLPKSVIYKYDTFREAEEAAWEHLSDLFPYYIQIPDKIPLGQVITIHNVANFR